MLYWQTFMAYILFFYTAPGHAASLEVDGQAVSGDLVPLPAEGAPAVTVKVTLGG